MNKVSYREDYNLVLNNFCCCILNTKLYTKQLSRISSKTTETLECYANS